MIFVTAGCDGSGSSSSSNSEYVSGVAATGAPAVGTIVTLTDSNGEVKSTTSGSDGSYSIEVTGLTAPYVIWFETDGKTIYATNCGSDKVNVTPLSDVVTRAVYQQAGGEGNPDASMIPDGECTTVQNQIKEIIEPVLELYGLDKDTDFISQEDFSADTFGLDGIFDDYNMEINEEGSFVLSSRIDNQPIINVSVDDIATPDESVEDADLTETITLRMLNHVVGETTFEDFGGDNASRSLVSSDLNLYETTHNGVSASWSSSDTAVVANDGTVNVPDSSTRVTLTLTLSKNGFSVTKEFEVTVVETDDSGDSGDSGNGGDNGDSGDGGDSGDSADADAVATDVAALDFDDFKNANTANTSITSDLNLPANGANGTLINWSSSNTNYISNTGSVTRPEASAGDQSVTLTATVSKGDSDQEKEFELTVTVPDADAVAADVAALDFDDLKNANTATDNIRTNLALPTSGANGTTISWESTNSGVINSSTGVVTRSHSSQSATLTATVSRGDESGTKDFTLTVKPYMFTSVKAGYDSSTGIKEDGSLWGWGSNFANQLGDGSTDQEDVPVDTASGNIWQSVSGIGRTGLGIKTGGALWGWGLNDTGQLGNNDTGNNSSVPIQIRSDKTWQSASGGLYHSLAIDSDGKLWAWGKNHNGELGNNDAGNDSSVPVEIRADKTWKSVSTGGVHSLAIDSDDKLWAWGSNSSGQLGNNDAGTDSAVPVEIRSDKTWQLVSGGHSHSLAIDSDGKLWVWGYNGSGQLGNNDTGTDSAVPVEIRSDKTWQSVSAGGSHSLAIDSDGKLWAWGSNSRGQVGNDDEGNNSPVPVEIMADKTWKSVAAGNQHSVAIDSDDNLWAWGRNTDGQVGNNDAGNNSPEPVQIHP